MPSDVLLLVDKPVGMTSFGVVARLRRRLADQLGKKRVKVGHAGTLDPFASGLMLILTGKMCSQAQSLLKHNKSYQATLVLGWQTPTLDPEGKLTRVARFQPSEQQISTVLSSFVGKIMQVPPDFSALKINGRRAYDLARQGQAVDLPARPVEIYEIELINYCYPLVEFRVNVSSGTYIRSLVRDLGARLGTGAFCVALRRLSIGEYKIDAAAQLSDFGIVD